MGRHQKLSSLSIFFPAFNESKNLPTLIEKTVELTPLIAHKSEILVINDGSSDQTSHVVRRLQSKYPKANIQLVTHHTNMGYGAALRSGIAHAKCEWIFFTDADLQFDINQLRDLIVWSKQYQVIIGYRKNRADGLLRVFNARLFKLYIDLLFRLHVHDIDCAFKLMRADCVQPIQLTTTGAFTTSELLYKLKKRNIAFQQVPVDHYKRQHGQPTGASPKVILKGVFEAMSVYLTSKWQTLSS